VGEVPSERKGLEVSPQLIGIAISPLSLGPHTATVHLTGCSQVAGLFFFFLFFFFCD
jgi:hypothetical protein